jgi:Protein of unknown function (DUF1275)
MTEPIAVAGSARKGGSNFIGEARGLTLAGCCDACRRGRCNQLSALQRALRLLQEREQHSTCGRARPRAAGCGRHHRRADHAFRVGCRHRANARRLRWMVAHDLVLVGVKIFLAIAAVLAGAPEPMVLARGALNASMHHAENIPVSLTFVTGTLVRFGQRFGDFPTRRQTRWHWLLQASPWVGRIAGATLGAAIYARIGEAAIWIQVILAGLLAPCSATLPERG